MSRFGILKHGYVVPAAVAVVTYDTSIGNGVTNGFANLPLKAGAKRFYVNSSTGSDAHTSTQAQSASTPMATIAAAMAFVTTSQGDQVCLAEGTSYSETLPSLNLASGFSALYPFALQSYDPADPTNEAKMGRATTARPIVNTGGTANTGVTGAVTTPASYIAVRGFKMGAAAAADLQVSFTGSNGLSNHYVLIENNVFAYTMLVDNQDPRDRAFHHIIRGNSFYGMWASVSTTGGATYLGGINSLTVEENTGYHVGWSIALNNRDATDTSGGANIYRHFIYMQDTVSGIIRRNVAIDSSTTGYSLRGDVDAHGNVSIDNPIAIIGGLGNFYQYVKPNGEPIFISANAILGDADISSTLPRGGAISTGNGVLGSKTRYNLIARSRAQTTNNYDFNIQAGVLSPTSNMDFHDNVEYLWSQSGSVIQNQTGPFAAAAIGTYETNAWTDPASGSNVNIASHTMPNAYTAATLYAALSLTDKATAVARWRDHPEDRPASTITALLMPGYAVGAVLTPENVMLSVTKFINSAAAVSCILGVMDGSTLVASGLPASVTLDSNNRVLAYDGTATFSPTSITITETTSTGLVHTTTLSIQAVASPTLGTITLSASLVSGTPSSGTLVGPYGTYGESWIEQFDALPAGFTFESATGGWPGSPSRTWSYDGTTFAHGSFRIIETLKGAANSPHTSTITF